MDLSNISYTTKDVVSYPKYEISNQSPHALSRSMANMFDITGANLVLLRSERSEWLCSRDLSIPSATTTALLAALFSHYFTSLTIYSLVMLLGLSG